MEEILVKTALKTYPIRITKGFESLNDLAKTNGFCGRKLILITDSNVAPIYGKIVRDILADVFEDISVVTFEAGENQKNLDTIQNFYRVFLEKKVDRKTVVAALGGCVCGYMAGFAAATYLRGIPFIQIPTTLLAQVDSSVGGKTGVDFCGNKNFVGAFYQPEFVFINTDTLDTFPEREFNAGMAEVIKYGPIWSEEFYYYLKTHKNEIRQKKPECLSWIIGESCRIKGAVVGSDEREKGQREILNFGHTIGHAIESCKGFELLHGECVSIGMAAVMAIAEYRGYISNHEKKEFLDLLTFFDLPIKTDGINAQEVYRQMFRDKKVKDNKISFVLTKKMGETIRTTDVSEAEVMLALNTVI